MVDGWVKQDARAAALIGSVIGVPARANMLAALAGGQALTATELAMHAGVTPQTASSHLKKMTDANFLLVEKQGRHRYYRLSDPRMVDALEPLAHLVPDSPVVHKKPSKQLQELRASRMCYDHLAGVLGVALVDAMKSQGYLDEGDEDFTPTEAGLAFFGSLDIDIEKLRGTRRHLARRCLDWSERRPHLGGALGAALADQFLERGWISRVRDSRKINVTVKGKRAFKSRLDIALN
jgi:DNA-binding transcriptional ArsR family regulator